jgi:hypothetical protein
MSVFFSFTFLSDTGSHHVAQAGLEFVMFLPQPSECWAARKILLLPLIIYSFLFSLLFFSCDESYVTTLELIV